MIEQFEPGRMMRVTTASDREKARLENLRLECLKLANAEAVMSPDGVIGQAAALFAFVTDAPKRPTLFVVFRRDPDTGQIGNEDYLTISGTWVHFGYRDFAYRFRSMDEALDAIAKFTPVLGGHMRAVPLPDGYELF